MNCDTFYSQKKEIVFQHQISIVYKWNFHKKIDFFKNWLD